MSATTNKKFQKTWTSETIEHKGFKDLGKYVIELPDYTDASMQEKGLAIMNDFCDHGKINTFGCTALAKTNSKGEVIFGRNMDLEISQTPAFVFKTTYGKYETFSVTYMPGMTPTYEEMQKLEALDEDILTMLPYFCCDSINEKGLYIEGNMRTRNPKLSCYGLHSAHGEKTRGDGIPWSELRACNMSIAQPVAQNCATVKEAVDFLENSYDWYTYAPEGGDESGTDVADCNICFMIGDATGEFGLIEMAQDELSYIPYQYGQANSYITPKWDCLDTGGAGAGRLGKGLKSLDTFDTLDEAMDAMKPIMWKNEILWIGESVRADDKNHLHPYNQIVFQDDKGEPQLDWRGEYEDDYVEMWPILENGLMVIPQQLYEDAVNSTYDPKIREYLDDGLKSGVMVIDDGSFTFDVNGEQVTATDLWKNYTWPETNADDPEKRKAMNDIYLPLLRNLDRPWVHNDDHFEALKGVVYARLHIRYDENKKLDASGLSKYEKMLAFYGYGVEKDESILRDDGTIWTTAMNVGVNCARKEMKIRFWEDDEAVYEVKF